MSGEDLIGKKFNKLQILDKDLRIDKNRYWICQCECGNTKSIFEGHLKSGKIKSCGCLRKETHSKLKWKGCGEISGRYFSSFQCASRKKGREFSVSIEFLWSLFLKQDRKCAISGVEICFINGRDNRKNNKSTASLDRIDSSKGYTEDNVQWVHKDVNYMKQEQSDAKFIDWCHIISQYQKDKNNAISKKR